MRLPCKNPISVLGSFCCPLMEHISVVFHHLILSSMICLVQEIIWSRCNALDETALFLFALLFLLYCGAGWVERFSEWWHAPIFNELFILCLVSGNVWCLLMERKSENRERRGIENLLVTFCFVFVEMHRFRYTFRRATKRHQLWGYSVLIKVLLWCPLSVMLNCTVPPWLEEDKI